MAESNTTKQAMAFALKELMEEVPFEKISVSHICERCDMNRKSFYYHFKDKYDLVNWIFDIDFISFMTQEGIIERWELFEALINYFYENRSFYRKVLKVKGQNSFSEHFRELLHPIIRKRLDDIIDASINHNFMVCILTDTCVCAIERWLSEKNCMPPKQFVQIIRTLTESIAVTLYKEMN